MISPPNKFLFGAHNLGDLPNQTEINNESENSHEYLRQRSIFFFWMRKIISFWFQSAGDLSATTKTIDFERLHNFARSAPQPSTTVRPFHSQPSNSGVEKMQQRVRFKHVHSNFKKLSHGVPDDVDKVRKCAVIFLQIKLKWDSRWNWS